MKLFSIFIHAGILLFLLLNSLLAQDTFEEPSTPFIDRLEATHSKNIKWQKVLSGGKSLGNGKASLIQWTWKDEEVTE